MSEDKMLELFQARKENQDKMQSRRKTQSKQNLEDNISKKMRTLMVGALKVLEDNFGHLWAHKSTGKKTPEQQQWHAVYLLCRELIFNLGNRQIKNATKEIDRYDIVLNPYRYNLTTQNKPKLED